MLDYSHSLTITADKYKKTENLTIKDKINRLSGHSIAKKTARFSQYIKHETGMVPKVTDKQLGLGIVWFFFDTGAKFDTI